MNAQRTLTEREAEIRDEYLKTLQDLTVNSKPLIDVLTEVAEENHVHASVIADCIEEQLLRVPASLKLPILYLIDSIIKNTGQHYIHHFGPKLDKLFSVVYEQGDEIVRNRLLKVRCTWNTVLPHEYLSRLDGRIRMINPTWLAAHINPKFVTQCGNTTNSYTISNNVVVPKPHPPLTKKEIEDKQKELEEKQKELLLLEQRKKIIEQEMKELKNKNIANPEPPPKVQKPPIEIEKFVALTNYLCAQTEKIKSESSNVLDIKRNRESIRTALFSIRKSMEVFNTKEKLPKKDVDVLRELLERLTNAEKTAAELDKTPPRRKVILDRPVNPTMQKQVTPMTTSSATIFAPRGPRNWPPKAPVGNSQPGTAAPTFRIAPVSTDLINAVSRIRDPRLRRLEMAQEQPPVVSANTDAMVADVNNKDVISKGIDTVILENSPSHSLNASDSSHVSSPRRSKTSSDPKKSSDRKDKKHYCSRHEDKHSKDKKSSKSSSKKLDEKIKVRIKHTREKRPSISELYAKIKENPMKDDIPLRVLSKEERQAKLVAFAEGLAEDENGGKVLRELSVDCPKMAEKLIEIIHMHGLNVTIPTMDNEPSRNDSGQTADAGCSPDGTVISIEDDPKVDDEIIDLDMDDECVAVESTTNDEICETKSSQQSVIQGLFGSDSPKVDENQTSPSATAQTAEDSIPDPPKWPSSPPKWPATAIDEENTVESAIEDTATTTVDVPSGYYRELLNVNNNEVHTSEPMEVVQEKTKTEEQSTDKKDKIRPLEDCEPVSDEEWDDIPQQQQSISNQNSPLVESSTMVEADKESAMETDTNLESSGPNHFEVLRKNLKTIADTMMQVDDADRDESASQNFTNVLNMAKENLQSGNLDTSQYNLIAKHIVDINELQMLKEAKKIEEEKKQTRLSDQLEKLANKTTENLSDAERENLTAKPASTSDTVTEVKQDVDIRTLYSSNMGLQLPLPGSNVLNAAPNPFGLCLPSDVDYRQIFQSFGTGLMMAAMPTATERRASPKKDVNDIGSSADETSAEKRKHTTDDDTEPKRRRRSSSVDSYVSSDREYSSVQSDYVRSPSPEEIRAASHTSEAIRSPPAVEATQPLTAFDTNQPSMVTVTQPTSVFEPVQATSACDPIKPPPAFESMSTHTLEPIQPPQAFEQIQPPAPLEQIEPASTLEPVQPPPASLPVQSPPEPIEPSPAFTPDQPPHALEPIKPPPTFESIQPPPAFEAIQPSPAFKGTQPAPTFEDRSSPPFEAIRSPPKIEASPPRSTEIRSPPQFEVMRSPPKFQTTQPAPAPLMDPTPTLPPANFELLNLIDADPVRSICIDGMSREIRHYGSRSIVFLSWDDPRELSFYNGKRRATINNQKSIPLELNGPPVTFKFFDFTHTIQLGTPTREIIVDNVGYECHFGGPPLKLKLSNFYDLLRLDGPPPSVKIGESKQLDLVAGKVSIIINARDHFPIYLDAKPQRFYADDIPIILMFVDSLKTVLLNNVPFPAIFGGLPQSFKAGGLTYYFRFTMLPDGIVPGALKISQMLETKIPSPPRMSSETVFSTPNVTVPGITPFVSNTSAPSTTSDPTKTSDTSEKNSLELLTSIVSTSNATLKSNKEYNSERTPYSKDSESGQDSAPSSVAGVLGSLSIDELFQKLVASGIVPPGRNENEEVDKPVNLRNPSTLKRRQPKMVKNLYSGIQCATCGTRFLVEQTNKYSEHLDWHFRMNRKSREGARTIHSRKYYLNLSDWIKFSESDDNTEKGASWFDCNPINEYHEELEEVPCISASSVLSPACELCCDKFEQFYSQELEEWQLRKAILIDSKAYHPVCYEDYKEKLNSTPDVEEIIQINEMIDVDDVSPTCENDITFEEDTRTIDEINSSDNAKMEVEEKVEEIEGTDDVVEIKSPVRVKEEKVESVTKPISIVDEAMTSEDDDSSEFDPDDVQLIEQPIEQIEINDDPLDDDEDSNLETLNVRDIVTTGEDKPPTPDRESPMVDMTATLSAGVATIDGNMEFEEARAIPVSGGGSRIRINIVKQPASSDPLEVITVDDVVAEPPPPGVELPAATKPRIAEHRLTEYPAVLRGNEVSGLCTIM